MVNELSERAKQELQKMYEGTFDYIHKSVGVDLRNIFTNKKEEPKPQYKDTVPDDEYWQEVVAIMDGLYKEEKGDKKMNELIKLVEKWSQEKGLDRAESSKQALKFFEEAGEVSAALARSNKDDLTDAIGDTIVTLIILAQQQGMTVERCLAVAYDEIKGRKGKTINGVFVKSEDLKEVSE